MGGRHHVCAEPGTVRVPDLVTDAYSPKIVDYHVHSTLQTTEVAEALQMAMRSRRGQAPLIHHSDHKG